MAVKNNESESAYTPKEIAEFTARQQRIEQYAKAAKDALKLVDLQNPPSKNYTVYSKASLRNFLKNPLTDSNQKSLRKVSQFLYGLSAQYRRLVAYFASQIDLTAYSVIPNINITSDNDNDSLKANYETTLKWLETMNLAEQIFSMLVTCWKEDCFFGYIFYNKLEDGSWDKNNFYIMPFDGDYCKISSVNFDHTLNMAFDFSYFSGSNAVYLDYWGPDFKKGYDKYKQDSKERWQELDPNRTVVLKVNYEQLDRVIPPLASLFESIIDLIDLQSIISEKNALDIYKLLIAKIDTISGAKDPDDFAIDLSTAVDFYNKMAAQLPEQVGIVLSPMTIEPINFEKRATEDSNQISKSNSNLWEAAGVSQVMDQSKLTGATAVRNAMIFDGLYSTRPLLAQIEARVNRFLDYVIPDNKMRLKYMDVTPYTKDEKIKAIKEAATLGLPVKLQYASLIGLSPMDTYALTYLENNILNLSDNWMPLVSGYTQGAATSDGGAPQKDITELSPEGLETRDKDKNDN